MDSSDQSRDLSHIYSRQGCSKDSLSFGFAEHLLLTLGKDRFTATDHDKFIALSYALRDRITRQWLKTQQKHYDNNVKRVYYLSLEFLMGRALGNNIRNLGLWKTVSKSLGNFGISIEELEAIEADAGLGNGGLGRLAACFLDSMATMNLPSFGYGLRYNYGIFRQEIENGYQREHPDEWLRYGYPWEIERRDISYLIRFGGSVETFIERGVSVTHWIGGTEVNGIAYDTPIVGYGGETVNTLRLWSAKAARDFQFDEFNEGDYTEAVRAKNSAENLTKVLYPNDKNYCGKELRLKQQYLFVACSLADIIRRFEKSGLGYESLPDTAAIQLNDTHPAIAVPELMRILIDEKQIDHDSAWDITRKTFSYTNHTLMPEALEKWPCPMLERVLPRHLQIIYDINYRFMEKVAIAFPGDQHRLSRMSLVEETPEKQIRMAYLSIIGSHSTNGVAALHTELLRKRLVPDFAKMYPDRFNNKTNGITQRRWLLSANPDLAHLVSETIGDGWITNMDRLEELKPYADDKAFREKFYKIKQKNKQRFTEFAKKRYDIVINPESLFDVQVKRIHEYKRQLLNLLNIVMTYCRYRYLGTEGAVPRTFLIAGKAAPGYHTAKMIIKLINNVAKVINNDPKVNQVLALHFIPNYGVSLAEKIIPAADISEQISTAGTEASGTGNMKFMCNGALTIGTLDGANIEIVNEVGEDNAFIFGLKADEVEALQGNFNPWQFCLEHPEIKEAIDLLFSGHFNVGEPNIFDIFRDILFTWGDHYMHIADLESYHKSQKSVDELYNKKEEWTKKAILNVAASGKFSSDRTIREYASEIWKVSPCPVGNGECVCNPVDELRI